MSLDASVWAWSQTCQKSSSKLVLLSLADRAGADHCAYPSVETLSSDTELNRKTVIAALHALVELGLIRDTGKRKGQTGKVVVYQLIGVVGRDEGRKQNPKKPATKQSQNRNDSKSGTVPKSDSNSPKNGTLNSPKNGTQNQSVEPTNESLKDNGEKSSSLAVCVEVISYLNAKAEKRFRNCKTNQTPILARLSDGYTLDDMKSVIDKKVTEWLHDPKMNQYLCPETLFRPGKFEKYLNATASLPYGASSMPPIDPNDRSWATDLNGGLI